MLSSTTDVTNGTGSPCRHQDIHNQSHIMVKASGRWLGARLDLLASLLIAVVAVAAIVVSQDAGGFILQTRHLQDFCIFVSNILTNNAPASVTVASWQY